MAEPTLEELTTASTRQEVEASIYQALALVGIDVTAWQSGSFARALVTAVAIVLASLSALIALIAQMGFLDFATGTWLTIVARYQYGLDRIAATFATGTIQIVNAGGGIYAWDPGELTVICGVTGKEYRNVDTLNVGALATVTSVFAAVEAGSESSAAVGQITTLVGVPDTVTASNTTTFAGTDAESDVRLRARCKAAAASRSMSGPWQVYQTASLTATKLDGSNAGVVSVQVIPNSGTNTVAVVACLADGTLPGTSSDRSTALGAVTFANRSVAPAPTYVSVAAPTLDTINLTATAVYYTDVRYTQTQLTTRAVAALTSLFAEIPIGGVQYLGSGYVFATAITDAIQSAAVGYIPKVVLNVGDVPVANGHRPTLGTVNITWAGISR